MDLIQLFIRLLAFGVTLFMLLEFIVVCKVETLKAILFLIATIVIVFVLFVIFKKYIATTCETCGNTTCGK